MSENINTFWNNTRESYDVVTRRILFPFGHKLGEAVLSIAPGQPVCDISTMSDAMLKAATVHSKGLGAGDTLTPQLTFADIWEKDGKAMVHTATGRELPVWQLAEKTHMHVDDMSFTDHMKAAHAAMPTAAVAPGDHAVGFLVRDEVLHFYPVLSITIPEDSESYKAGEGSTNDVIPLLPFQS